MSTSERWIVASVCLTSLSSLSPLFCLLSVAADTAAFLRLEDVVHLSDDSSEDGGGGDEMVDGSVDIPITNLAVRANPVTDCSR